MNSRDLRSARSLAIRPYFRRCERFNHKSLFDSEVESFLSLKIGQTKRNTLILAKEKRNYVFLLIFIRFLLFSYDIVPHNHFFLTMSLLNLEQPTTLEIGGNASIVINALSKSVLSIIISSLRVVSAHLMYHRSKSICSSSNACS